MLKTLFGLHVHTLFMDNIGTNADDAAFRLMINRWLPRFLTGVSL